MQPAQKKADAAEARAQAARDAKRAAEKQLEAANEALQAAEAEAERLEIEVRHKCMHCPTVARLVLARPCCYSHQLFACARARSRRVSSRVRKPHPNPLI